MTMKKYHGHTLLYLHETIDLGSGRSDGFTEVFSDVYQPMMEELGARLFAIWETTPYNGHWPQVTIIWEIDAFADYARIGRAQARGGSHEAAAGEVVGVPAPRSAPRGEGRIMYAGPEQQDAGATQGGELRRGPGDPGDHADQAGPPGRLHPRTRAALRAVVGDAPASAGSARSSPPSGSTRSSTTGRSTATGTASRTTTRRGRTARPPRSSPG